MLYIYNILFIHNVTINIVYIMVYKLRYIMGIISVVILDMSFLSSIASFATFASPLLDLHDHVSVFDIWDGFPKAMI